MTRPLTANELTELENSRFNKSKPAVLKFRNVPVGARFEFPVNPDSRFHGAYKKISARMFTDGERNYACAASAIIARIIS